MPPDKFENSHYLFAWWCMDITRRSHILNSSGSYWVNVMFIISLCESFTQYLFRTEAISTTYLRIPICDSSSFNFLIFLSRRMYRANSSWKKNWCYSGNFGFPHNTLPYLKFQKKRGHSLEGGSLIEGGGGHLLLSAAIGQKSKEQITDIRELCKAM